MTREKFNEILQSQAPLDITQVQALTTVLNEFPYFQAARALRLKGYHQQQDFNYNSALKLTAAHTLDRSVLFELITSDEFLQEHISQRINKRHADELKAEQEKEWERSVQMNREEAERVFDPQLFEESEGEKKTETVSEDVVPQEASADTFSAETVDNAQEKSGQPVHFDKSEQHSFAEWLKLTSVKKIERSAEKQVEEPPKREEQIIDEFIKKAPKIKPVDKIGTSVTVKTNSPSEHLMTETLAKIYAEQKNFDKAIQAYKILILKNPEKSALFADRIRDIENIRENKNK